MWKIIHVSNERNYVWFVLVIILLSVMYEVNGRANQFVKRLILQSSGQKKSSLRQSFQLNPRNVSNELEWIAQSNALLSSQVEKNDHSIIELQLRHFHWSEAVWSEGLKNLSQTSQFRNNDDDGDDSPISLFTTTSSLSQRINRLDLSFNGFDLHHYRVLAPKLLFFPHLTELIFDGCNLNQENSLRILMHSLRKLPQLRYLSLSHCHLPDLSLTLLNRLLNNANSSIQFLDLSQNQISVIGLRDLFPIPSLKKDSKLAVHFTSKIQYLDLSYNTLGDEGMDYLCQLIQNHYFSHLKHLILRDIQCSEQSVAKLFDTLATAIENHQLELQTLDISGNPIVSPSPSSSKSKTRTNKLYKLYEQQSNYITNAVLATVDTISQNIQSYSSINEKKPLRTKYSVGSKRLIQKGKKSKGVSKAEPGNLDETLTGKKLKAKNKMNKSVTASEKFKHPEDYKIGKILLHFLSVAKSLQALFLLKTNINSSFLQLLQKIFEKEFSRAAASPQRDEERERIHCELQCNGLSSLDKDSFSKIVQAL